MKELIEQISRAQEKAGKQEESKKFLKDYIKEMFSQIPIQISVEIRGDTINISIPHYNETDLHCTWDGYVLKIDSPKAISVCSNNDEHSSYLVQTSSGRENIELGRRSTLMERYINDCLKIN